MKKELRDYFAQMGRKGGKKGGKATGERKRRTDAFYIELARKGVAARQKARALAKERAEKATGSGGAERESPVVERKPEES